jgi:hypothetical protein
MPEQELIPSFQFLEDEKFDPNLVEKQELLPGDTCFVLYNLFTLKECEQLIEEGERYGFLSLGDTYSASYRNNERIINYNERLKEVMWQRITKYLDNTIEILKTHETLHTNYYTSGIWEKDGLNNNFRLCKYQPNMFFKSHYDEGYHPDRKAFRTMKTCMLYLNDNFSGGETVFYFSGGHEYSLKPAPGMCLVFNQKIMHEGKTVINGLKYFTRTDILYKKIESHDIHELTPIQNEALKIYEEGVQLENDHQSEEAIKRFKKATKLYGEIYELYNELYN